VSFEKAQNNIAYEHKKNSKWRTAHFLKTSQQQSDTKFAKQIHSLLKHTQYSYMDMKQSLALPETKLSAMSTCQHLENYNFTITVFKMYMPKVLHVIILIPKCRKQHKLDWV